MTAETRLAELLETEFVATNKAVLFADITAVVGLEATALVVGTIKAAGAQNPLMDTILIAMSTVGLSLSTAERQGVIDMLAAAGSWPDAVRDAVKALGGATRPKWVGEGYKNEPTLEFLELESEWAALQNDGGINVAIANGDRAALIAALTAAVDSLGGA